MTMGQSINEIAQALESGGTTGSVPLDETRYRDMRRIWMRNTHYCWTCRGHGRRSWRHRDGGWKQRLADSPDGIQLSDHEQPVFANRYLSSRLRLVLRHRLHQHGSQLALSAGEAVSKDWFSLASGKIPCDNAAGARGCAAHGNGLFTITGTTENRSCSSPFHQQEPRKAAVAQPRLSCWETWSTCGGKQVEGFRKTVFSFRRRSAPGRDLCK